MGCDGGTTAVQRKFLLKQKKAGEKADQAAVNEVRWSRCALSNEALKAPVVVCPLGNLFNKERVLEALVDKSLPAKFNHIRSLKDLTTVHLTPRPADAAEDAAAPAAAAYICPVTRVEMAGTHSFCALTPCGCVMASRVLKEVRCDTCPSCNAAFQAADVITLNPNAEQLEAMRAALRERQARAKAEKKTKRKDKSAAAAAAAAAASASGSAAPSHSDSPPALASLTSPPGASASPGTAEAAGAKRKGAPAAAPAAAASSAKRQRGTAPAVATTGALSTAAKAAEAVRNARQNSTVFASLFFKKADGAASGSSRSDDLFMRTAALRFNV